MNESLLAEELAKRFGLAPLPESVARLTELVARQGADLEDVAKIISQDKELSARLCRMAGMSDLGGAAAASAAVWEALRRHGMGPILLLAMSEPLVRAVAKTFLTMLDLRLEAASPADFPAGAAHLVAGVDFYGQARGAVDLRLTEDSARALARRLLGLAPEAALAESDLFDAIGELVNMVTGNFQSNLCDAGLKSTLAAPVIQRTRDLQKRNVPGGVAQRIAFRCAEAWLLLDVSVNPWKE